MRTLSLFAAATLFACDDGGGSSDTDGGAGGAGGGGGASRTIEGPGPTVAYATTYDSMLAISARPNFSAADFGDPAAYVNSEATTPTDPQVMASQYYETGGFRDAVERVRDRRPGVERDDSAGADIAAEVAKGIQIGAAVDGATTGRNSPPWYAQQAVRSLDRYFVLAVHDGLSERSAAGFDRAVGVLWDQDGPHGLGALIGAADDACGSTYLADIDATLQGAKQPLIDQLAESGLPDALDRLVIQEGESAEYDAAIESVRTAMTQGTATLFLASLQQPLDARGQAALLAAYEALSADVVAASQEADSTIRSTLDAQDAGDIDRDAVATAIAEQLSVSCE